MWTSRACSYMWEDAPRLPQELGFGAQFSAGDLGMICRQLGKHFMRMRAFIFALPDMG